MLCLGSASGLWLDMVGSKAVCRLWSWGLASLELWNRLVGSIVPMIVRTASGANWNRPDNGSLGGVSWLIRRPRKNLIKTLIANDNFALAA